MKKALVIGLVALASAPVAGQARTTDRTRPTVRYATSDGAVLVGGAGAIEGLPTTISGTARDGGTGVARIRVWAVPCNTQASDTSCAYTGPSSSLTRLGSVAVACGRGRTSCSWSVGAPAQPGWYWVGAEAVDRAGNISRAAGILRVFVA